MAAVTLPASPAPNSADPRFLLWGSDQKGSLGAATTHIDRLGSRFAIDVKMPPMKSEPDGRLWVAALIEAKEGGSALMKFHQLGLVIGAPGAPVVNGATAATLVTVPMRGLTAGYTVRRGQFFSVIQGGRRYLYMSRADTVASGGGVANVPVSPMIRAALADGATIELAVPMIEGHLLGEDQPWNLNSAHHTGLTFSIEENE